MPSWHISALLLLGGSTALLFAGVPVAFSFLAVNLIGAALFLGGAAGLEQIVRNSVVAVANFSLTPIPLFVLMGEILFHTGLALSVIEGIERLIRPGPGGVGGGGGGWRWWRWWRARCSPRPPVRPSRPPPCSAR